MKNRKADVEQFKAHINHLRVETPAGAQSWWPLYLYHFTDVLNAASILNTSTILSRNEAISRGHMKSDNASTTVISQTSVEVKDYVRMYLRPKTPTQYHNEGFRPSGQRSLESHCPVPIFFFLDALDILTMEDSLFSEGNLAAGATLMSSGTEFASLPFEKIYHSGALGESEKRNIVYHRHAEVVVPTSLELSPGNLKFIWCRSPAEKETLVSLLDDETRSRWVNRIGEGVKLGLYYCNRTYIQEAEIGSSTIKFEFNPNTETPGPFVIVVTVKPTSGGRILTWRNDSYYARHELALESREPLPESCIVECTLDGHIAYRVGRVRQDNIPF